LAFEHVAARLHAIGVQAAREAGLTPNTLILFNGHASLPTGEDGPTHADPQSLQLVQDNFPQGACITATPMEVDEIWPLVTKSLSLRPAVFAPFAARPSNAFLDRKALGMDPAEHAANGLYYMHRAKGKADGTVMVQGAGVGRIVAEKVLPELAKNKLNVNIVYITSRELFEALPRATQEKLLPLALRQTAMGITDFTRPTLDAWLLSQAGREHALWPHRNGAFLGSGSAGKVYEEAGLSGADMLAAIKTYVKDLKKAKHWL
jgi:transketolase